MVNLRTWWRVRGVSKLMKMYWRSFSLKYLKSVCHSCLSAGHANSSFLVKHPFNILHPPPYTYIHNTILNFPFSSTYTILASRPDMKNYLLTFSYTLLSARSLTEGHHNPPVFGVDSSTRGDLDVSPSHHPTIPSGEVTAYDNIPFETQGYS